MSAENRTVKDTDKRRTRMMKVPTGQSLEEAALSEHKRTEVDGIIENVEWATAKNCANLETALLDKNATLTPPHPIRVDDNQTPPWLALRDGMIQGMSPTELVRDVMTQAVDKKLIKFDGPQNKAAQSASLNRFLWRSDGLIATANELNKNSIEIAVNNKLRLKIDWSDNSTSSGLFLGFTKGEQGKREQIHSKLHTLEYIKNADLSPENISEAHFNILEKYPDASEIDILSIPLVTDENKPSETQIIKTMRKQGHVVIRKPADQDKIKTQYEIGLELKPGEALLFKPTGTDIDSFVVTVQFPKGNDNSITIQSHLLKKDIALERVKEESTSVVEERILEAKKTYQEVNLTPSDVFAKARSRVIGIGSKEPQDVIVAICRKIWDKTFTVAPEVSDEVYKYMEYLLDNKGRPFYPIIYPTKGEIGQIWTVFFNPATDELNVYLKGKQQLVTSDSSVSTTPSQKQE